MAMISSTLAIVKAYSLPLILFTGAMFYQLFVIPRSFPPSHYDVLGVKMYAPIEEVEESYEKLSSRMSETDSLNSLDFAKVRYAYELLTNPVWRRNYDIFGIEEQHHVVEEAKQRFAGKQLSDVHLPLLDVASVQGEDNFNAISAEDFKLILQSDKPSLVLVYSSSSGCCSHYGGTWKRIVSLLDGVANAAAAVELGEVQVAAYLAEKKSAGKPFFRNGLPSLVAFPSGCKTVGCSIRFEGHLSVDAVTDWFATTVLGLPRILYYSKESLAQSFMAKSSPHKVKVIFFSKTGERATPFVRLAALKYWDHVSFAFMLWREEDSSLWWNTFEVESAPAIVFLKDPGAKPAVYHGSVNNSQFADIMERNKYQELPQLRSVTSNELGCDARSYSRAGADTISWYCVVLAGRLSPELNSMRATMRRVQEILSNDIELDANSEDTSLPAAVALKRKRLTFTWLNGETQKKYCFFYLQSETSYETCGPRRDITDVPGLFIIRYKRNLTEENEPVRRKPKTMWDALNDQDYDRASQLVARYNGSNEIPQIIEWVSSIIKDGDSRDLPFFRTKTPELVPEEADPIISRGVQGVLSKSTGIKQKVFGIVRGLHDRLGDPRIGPVLLLGALMSFGRIWLRRSQGEPPSQSNQPNQPNETTQPNSKDEIRKRRKKWESNLWDKEQPSSVTDVEPKNAYQMPLSDSDSD